jgi:hypothetical protein
LNERDEVTAIARLERSFEEVEFGWGAIEEDFVEDGFVRATRIYDEIEELMLLEWKMGREGEGLTRHL